MFAVMTNLLSWFFIGKNNILYKTSRIFSDSYSCYTGPFSDYALKFDRLDYEYKWYHSDVYDFSERYINRLKEIMESEIGEVNYGADHKPPWFGEERLTLSVRINRIIPLYGYVHTALASNESFISVYEEEWVWFFTWWSWGHPDRGCV